MPLRKQILPSTSSSESPNNIAVDSFRLKPIGSITNRNTLVENDSLSSYSWPDETLHSNKGRRQSGEKAEVGANQDSNENVAEIPGQDKTSNSRFLQDKGVVCINMENIEDTETYYQLTYIQAYMKFMYWTCVCPFDPMAKNETDVRATLKYRVLGLLQKVCFAIIAFLSIIHSCLEGKYHCLKNFSNGNLEPFINMSYFILVVATKVYIVYLLLRQQSKFAKMFKSMNKLHAFKMNESTTENFKTSMIYTTVLGIGSIVVSIVYIIWTVGHKEWTPQKTLQYHFEVMTEDILVWNLNEYENGTLVEKYIKQNGNGLTQPKIFLGFFRMFMVFCSGLQIDALTNMMLTNAQTIDQEMSDLEDKISHPESDITDCTLNEFLAANGHWAHFKLLKRALNDSNVALDSLLKYKHANNLMLCVYFVLNVFDGEFSVVYAVRLLYNIIRASYTYRIATQASSLNDAKRKWVRRLAWKSNDKAFLKRVPLILDELEKEPIGMGKGQFLIDESFLYRFIGSVGSVFVLQAQSREAKIE